MCLGLVLTSQDTYTHDCSECETLDYEIEYVIISEGQSNTITSNCLGWYNGQRDRTEYATPMVQIWNNSSAAINASSFQSYIPCVTSGYTYQSRGFDFHMAEPMSKLLGKRVHVIKVSNGGSYMADVERTPPNSWHPDNEPMWDIRVREIKEALANINRVEDCVRYEAKVIGQFWIQGTSDAIDSLRAISYKDNLTLFVNNTRDLIGYEVPFFTWQFPDGSQTQYQSIVKQGAIDATDALTCAFAVNMDTLVFSNDGIHLTDHSSDEVGRMLYDAWLSNSQCWNY